MAESIGNCVICNLHVDVYVEWKALSQMYTSQEAQMHVCWQEQCVIAEEAVL